MFLTPSQRRFLNEMPNACPDCAGVTRCTCGYEEWLSTLDSYPGCGTVDVMDNIEGAPMCAACYLDEIAPPDLEEDEEAEHEPK